ncbi:hypothetical protein K469DRAFT_575591 [Zopfia rhizophila CBS 207.26]|uniref:BRCT domain-containing protein n=1 Tax=Zopfia rhizophila CBS 207.26 TaxID=1314779 RepID=A0A6A6E6C3_9PEZI|nr:hypothetical protein K469DRAFT_575591 [Zopfia rhizophila CBS 207.26]
MGILKKLVITATGDFGSGIDNNQLRKWVEANDGKWTYKVTKDTTHLICSKGHWKKEANAVIAARKVKAYIVTYDWLEDSLQSKKKLAEKRFTLEAVTKERRKKRELTRIAKKADTAKFEKGCEAARADTGSGTPMPQTALKPTSKPSTTTSKHGANPQVPRLKDNHHLYLDASGFEYNILLIRINLSKSTNSRYNIRLYESHTTPHVYCTLVRYAPPGAVSWPSANKHIPCTQPQAPSLLSNDGVNAVKTQQNKHETETERKELHPELIRALRVLQPEPYKKLLAPLNSTYSTASTAFRHAFEDLTFLKWEERHLPNATALQKARTKERGLEPFAYAKPAKGLPIGVMPQGPIEDNYIVGSLGLAGMDETLSMDGVVGSAIFREEESRIKEAREEEESRIRKEEEGKRGGMVKRVKVRNELFFNAKTRGATKEVW